MWDKLEAVSRSAGHAISLIVDRTAEVNLWGALLGTVLYLISQAVRTRAWHTILRAAYPEATGLRARDVMRAYLAGAGVNAIVPARGGDVLKLAMMHRRIEGSTYPTLVATFVPDALGEAIFGVALVGWAFSQGFLPIPLAGGELPSIDVSLIIDHPLVSAAAAIALVLFVWFVGRRLRLRGKLRQGVAILRRPRLFITGVASWQLLGRLIRLGSLAAFMAAFSLPVTVATVVLVMAAQGGGRIIPLGPASVGLRLAMLSYGFVEVTGQRVDIAAITAFTFGVGAILATAGLIVAVVILGQEFGTLSPRRAVERARTKLASATPTPTPVPAAVPGPMPADATP